MSGAGWLILRSRWRRQVGGQIVLALVIALAGGLTLATVAGARRTSTSLDRFVADAHLPDAFISIGGPGKPDLETTQLSAIESLPDVIGATRLRALAMAPAGSGLYQPTAGMLDERYGATIAVSRYVQGRAPRAADEVSMSEQRAQLLDLQLGDTVAMDSWTPDQVAAYAGNGGAFGDPEGPHVELRLVGIERTPQSLATDRDIASITVLPTAFMERYGDRIGTWGDLLAVDLRNDPDMVTDFTSAVHAIPGLEQLPLEVTDTATAAGPASDTIAFAARALLVLAAIVGIAGLVLVFVLMGRLAHGYADEDDDLRALGGDRRFRRRIGTAGLAPGALAGAVAAMLVAVAASSRFPFGLAGRAEPDPGLRIDRLVLAIGALILVFVLTVLAWFASRPSRRSARAARTASRRASWLMRAGAPFEWVLGSRPVVQRGRGSGSARAAALGVAIGSAGLVAALVFARSQDSLEHAPASWGQLWDAQVDGEVADAMPTSTAATTNDVHVSTLEIDGHPVQVRAFDSSGPAPMIVVTEGRPPGPGEIVLGRRTLGDVGAAIGDDVVVRGGLGETRLRVVGVGVFPGVVDVPELAVGAAALDRSLERVTDPEEDDGFSMRLVRFSSDDDRSTVASLVAARDGTDVEQALQSMSPGRPDELDRLAEVRAVPWVLAGFLGLLAVTATAAMLVAAVRRQRRDLAVLRAQGLDRAGARRVLVAQAIAVSTLGLVVGVPAGVILGRIVWRSVADGMGVVVHVRLPLLAIAASVLVVIAVDVVISLLASRRANRSSPAELLRAE